MNDPVGSRPWHDFEVEANEADLPGKKPLWVPFCLKPVIHMACKLGDAYPSCTLLPQLAGMYRCEFLLGFAEVFIR